jgi:ubiquitin carboxyl-terminal hydrolase 48
MDGDNQYFCSTCDKKCDATRSPKFENLPPVLNLQLNRYVFDMKTFSKQKLTTKVLLPHLLEVPLGDTKKTYTLVAVQYHLGTSAHGGHYVCNALDWNTGVWFEFNDEDVEVLESGPLSAFQPKTSNVTNGDKNGRRISGSADAYNLLYVEKGYMSSQSLSDLCLKEDMLSSSIDCDIYQEHYIKRQEQYKVEQE